MEAGKRVIEGRAIAPGSSSGPLLVSSQPISFYGGVDPETGIVVEKGHPLEGKAIGGTVLAFPRGKGSTVGSYILYRLKKNGHAPAAIINESAEAIVAVGAIISEIPMLDLIDFSLLPGQGSKVKIDVGKAARISGEW
ncbi:MAG: DUF126 domain-containing protein [Candidatus Micrarchaeia archaeon]